MAATVYGPHAITIGSTTVAMLGYSFSHGVLAELSQHSGNEFPTLVAVPGADPHLTFRAHLHDVLALIGLGAYKATTLSVFLAKYTDMVKSSSSDHVRLALTTSCTALVTIDGWSVSQDGIAIADCSAVYLSNDGAAHPVTYTANNALPALTAAAVVHTLGPVVINGTGVPGVTGLSFVSNHLIDVRRSDGDEYPRIATRFGGAPRLTVEHGDPAGVLGATGSTANNALVDGAAITADVVAYLRRFSATTGLVGAANGISFTAASGRAHPVEIRAEHGAIVRHGIEVIGLSSSSTNPFATSTSATVPAAA